MTCRVFCTNCHTMKYYSMLRSLPHCEGSDRSWDSGDILFVTDILLYLVCLWLVFSHGFLRQAPLHKRVYERVSGVQSIFHSTRNRSFPRRVFWDNRLHWYWQFCKHRVRGTPLLRAVVLIFVAVRSVCVVAAGRRHAVCGCSVRWPASLFQPTITLTATSRLSRVVCAPVQTDTNCIFRHQETVHRQHARTLSGVVRRSTPRVWRLGTGTRVEWKARRRTLCIPHPALLRRPTARYPANGGRCNR